VIVATPKFALSTRQLPKGERCYVAARGGAEQREGGPLLQAGAKTVRRTHAQRQELIM
jgi:hypothetical protein